LISQINLFGIPYAQGFGFQKKHLNKPQVEVQRMRQNQGGDLAPLSNMGQYLETAAWGRGVVCCGNVGFGGSI
jgi:hypothetical protein